MEKLIRTPSDSGGANEGVSVMKKIAMVFAVAFAAVALTAVVAIPQFPARSDAAIYDISRLNGYANRT